VTFPAMYVKINPYETSLAGTSQFSKCKQLVLLPGSRLGAVVFLGQ